jgi:hypothetical protein
MSEHEYLECPSCGEIELKRIATQKLHSETLYEYQCRCGHYATFSALPEVDTIGLAKPHYPGVAEALKEIGYDTLDSMSLQEVFTIGFVRGRTYEALDTIEKLKAIDIQAE